MNEILKSVSEYVNNKSNNKVWRAGEDWVKYAGPYFTDAEITAAVKTLLDGWLVLGKDAIQFERLFPKLMGKSNGVLTNSGSSSNLLMLAALMSKKLYNLPKNTKVIVPIAGFPTTVNPIFQLGFLPVFVDIELDTLNIDINKLEDALKRNPDVKVITFAHVLGNPPNMDAVMSLVKQYNLIFLEDTCDALNSFYDGKPLGSFGDMASCSFYPAHHITMGEGGFVATSNYQQETVVRSLREWGRGCYCVGEGANLLKNGTCKCRFSSWLPSMPDDIFDHKYVYDEIGYNMKPIELQASIGLEQLKKIDEITMLRKRNFSELSKIFIQYEEHFILPKATEKSDPNWFAFPLTLKNNSSFTRSNICEYLENNKIQTRPYFAGNLMLQPAYSGLVDQTEIKTLYPVATKVTTDTFFLGTSPVITLEQIDYIKTIINNFFNK